MPDVPATSPTEPKRSRLAKLLRPKVVIPVFLLVAVLLSPVLIRSWFLSGVPVVPEPFDPESLLSLEIPESENAFTDFRKAAALYASPSQHVAELRDGDSGLSESGIITTGWVQADDEVRKFLQDNEVALQVWRSATQKDQARHIHAKNYKYSSNIAFTTDQFREFQRTILLLTRKLEAEGNHAEAWDWYRAAVRSSRHAGTNGAIVERMIGTILFTMIAERLEEWSSQPDVPAELLRRAVRELASDWELTEQNSTVFQIEYLSLMHSIEELESGENGKSWRDLVSVNGEQPPFNSFTIYLLGEPKLGKRLLRLRFYNQLTDCDRFPFERNPISIGSYQIPPSSANSTEEPQTISVKEYDQLLHKSIIGALLMPSFDQAQFAFDRDEIYFRTILVTLAGQSFYRDHNHFPETLDELVPEYLESIPIDTFDGNRLKYRYSDEGPVAYSVSSNRTDEGGFEWDYDQARRAKKMNPDDLGFQMRIPGIKPLRADKPLIVEDDDRE